MSNLIKAQQIQYAEKVRTIDMNARADNLQQEFFDKYIAENIIPRQIDFKEVSRKLEAERVITPEDVDFTPGIVTEQVYVDESQGDSEDAPEEEFAENTGAAVIEIEARVREKKRELEAVQAQIAAANAEADKIIAKANADAQDIIDNARAEAEAQREEVFEQARTEGFEAGQEDARTQAAEAREECEAVKQQYKEEYEKQVEELEPAFVEIMINYIRKLTGIYAEDKREIILHLIDNAMKDKRGAENFIIRVSEADFAMASYSRDSMRQYLTDGATIEVVADKLLTKNQCMIETESRIFDCSLDSQMLSLIEDIRLLAEKD